MSAESSRIVTPMGQQFRSVRFTQFFTVGSACGPVIVTGAATATCFLQRVLARLVMQVPSAENTHQCYSGIYNLEDNSTESFKEKVLEN